MIRLTHILVATDFSEPAEVALAYGRALARTFSATLHVVHVVGDLANVAYGADGYVTALPELQRDIEDGARKQLAELLIDSDAQPLPTRQALLRSNAPALAIID